MLIHFTEEEIAALKAFDRFGAFSQRLMENEVRNQICDWHKEGDYRLVPTEMRAVELANKWKKHFVLLAQMLADQEGDEDAIVAEARAVASCLTDLYGHFQDILRSNR